MSFEITTAFVKQYSSNVWHLAQQKGSRLAGLVRNESQDSEVAHYDYVGPVTAQKRVGRHSDTTYQDTPHGRRLVTTEDYFFADLVDDVDKLRMLISPESEYSQAAMWALGRAMDDVIVSSALGDATGQTANEGTLPPIALPDSQKLGATDGASTTGSGLTVRTLRQVKKKFNQNEIEGNLYMAITAEQLDDLLADEQVVNEDYAAVKALVNGDIDTFMGFKFVRLERLPVRSGTFSYSGGASGDGSLGGGDTFSANARRCFAWVKEGVLLATASSVKGRISELPGKHYSNQVYASMSIGGTRLEEAKVVEVLCKE